MIKNLKYELRFSIPRVAERHLLTVISPSGFDLPAFVEVLIDFVRSGKIKAEVIANGKPVSDVR